MINATPLLRAYADYRAQVLHLQDAAQAQRRQLQWLLHKARNTKFGRDHGFSKIKDVEEYQRRVPLRKYEQFWEEYLKPTFPRVENVVWPGLIEIYSVSSGTTTGTTKWIPYSKEMTSSNTKAGLDLLSFHLKNKPSSQIFAGKSFMLGGTTKLVEQSPGIVSGDLSGIATKTMRSWIRPWYFPPPELALLENWEEKINLLARRSLREDIRMLGGVPTWLLLFLDKMAELHPEGSIRVKDFFPQLELLVHGGVPFGPYVKRFEEIFEGSNVDFREVYPSSEAFIAIADRYYGQGLRLLCDHGNFFEFVPFDELDSPNPTRHWVENIEMGVNYAVVVSSCAGNWSYILGDTVRFVEKTPPRLLITGRTSFFLSAFGEHLIAEEIDNAIAFASQQCGFEVNEYTIGALFPKQQGEMGRHLIVAECAPEQLSQEVQDQFCTFVDAKLCELNEDFRAHRTNDYGFKVPILRLVPSGSFNRWMKERGKFGGQHKIPRIIARNELFLELQQHLGLSV